jgi:hypothetical protein
MNVFIIFVIIFLYKEGKAFAIKFKDTKMGEKQSY